MEIISQVLHNRNPYARSYCTMHEIERRKREIACENGNVEVAPVTMHMCTGPDRRRCNEPLADEVAAIFTSHDRAPDISHDIVVYPHSRNLAQISYLSPNCGPMSFPLFYPSGEPCWSVNIPHVDEHATEHRNKVTLSQFYTYRWSEREGIFNPLHHGGYLTQVKAVSDFIKCDTSRLDYIEKQQYHLRVEMLHSLYDHVYTNDTNQNNNVTSHAPLTSHAPPSSPNQNNNVTSHAPPPSPPGP